jgi:hypothetical protein
MQIRPLAAALDASASASVLILLWSGNIYIESEHDVRLDYKNA